MGFFSYLTADKKQSIANRHSEIGASTVYLLQPHNRAPITESAYDGYGDFGGVNVFFWLARMNAKQYGVSIKGYDDEQLASLGQAISYCTVCRDVHSGDIWHVWADYRNLVPGKYFKGNWGAIIPEFGQSANQLIESGRWVEIELNQINPPKYPIKLSHNREAVYADLPESESCPYQGFHYNTYN